MHFLIGKIKCYISCICNASCFLKQKITIEENTNENTNTNCDNNNNYTIFHEANTVLFVCSQIQRHLMLKKTCTQTHTHNYNEKPQMEFLIVLFITDKMR